MDVRNGAMGGTRVLARRAVLFDFDGTLVDTGPAILDISARALRAHGYDPEAVGDLERLIGPPLVDGFMEVTGAPRADALELVATYRQLFARYVSPSDYRPFPGTVEMLRDLVDAGRPIAVATSRLDESVRRMLSELDLPAFDAVAGRLEPGRLTKADSIRACLEELGLDASEAVMVGDRAADVRGACEVGVPCIGVFRDERARAELRGAGADALCGGVRELRELLGI